MVHELNSLYRNLKDARGHQRAEDSGGGGRAGEEKEGEVELTAAAAAAAAAMEGMGNVVAFKDAFSNVGEATVSLMVEYMNGGSLQGIVDAGGCDDHPTLASIARQSLQGLRFLHRSHHLHRDIKPANMLINYQGEVKVSDFGIVRKLEAAGGGGGGGGGGVGGGEGGEDGMLDPGAARAEASGLARLKVHLATGICGVRGAREVPPLSFSLSPPFLP